MFEVTRIEHRQYKKGSMTVDATASVIGGYGTIFTVHDDGIVVITSTKIDNGKMCNYKEVRYG